LILFFPLRSDEATMRRISARTCEGVTPNWRRNRPLKYEMSPNPASKAITVIERSAKRESANVAVVARGF
jgi:hypothetical protein